MSLSRPNRQPRREADRGAGYAAGRQTGYGSGWEQGYRLGRCNAVERLMIPEAARGTIQKKVLYVTAGMGYPFSPIDEGILEGLRSAVSEVYACSPFDAVDEIAETWRPDLVLALNGMHLDPEKVAAVRALGIKTAIWFIDDPYYTDITGMMSTWYDYVFTMEMSCIDFYHSQRSGASVHYLPLAMDKRAFYPKHVPLKYQSEICFIGSAYWHRVHLFDRLAPYLAKKRVRIIGWWWNRMSNFSMLENQIEIGWLSPEETAAYYNGAKIVLNIHRVHDDESYNHNSAKIPGLSVNPRTFEISGTGAFQLTDVRHDLHASYALNTELGVYQDTDKLIDRIEYYLRNEEERRDIALRGYRRTLEEHTYPSRVRKLLDIVF